MRTTLRFAEVKYTGLTEDNEFELIQNQYEWICDMIVDCIQE
jgi:hypothetical protein